MRENRDEYGQSGEVVYLIAFKDGEIRAAIAYWADGNTVHYVTRDHQEHTVPMDELDRAFSERLNRDQRVPFQYSTSADRTSGAASGSLTEYPTATHPAADQHDTPESSPPR